MGGNDHPLPMETRCAQWRQFFQPAATMPAWQVMKEDIVPKESAETTYRAIHVTRPLSDRQAGRPPKGSTHRFGVMRLVAPRWRQSITLLIDWDRAVNEGWPDLRSPSCTRARAIRRIGRGHQASIRRLA